MLQAIERARNESLIKLGDFGLARIPVSTTGPMTRSPAGTEGYIAPEVLTGAPFSQAADIYSLGISAVELLAGVRDISKLATTAVPASLRQMILSMVSPLPAQRPTTSQGLRWSCGCQS